MTGVALPLRAAGGQERRAHSRWQVLSGTQVCAFPRAAASWLVSVGRMAALLLLAQRPELFSVADLLSLRQVCTEWRHSLSPWQRSTARLRLETPPRVARADLQLFTSACEAFGWPTALHLVFACTPGECSGARRPTGTHAASSHLRSPSAPFAMPS